MKYVVPAALRDKRTICAWCKQLQDAGGAVLADGEFARTEPREIVSPGAAPAAPGSLGAVGIAEHACGHRG
jgi:hypothetical protein